MPRTNADLASLRAALDWLGNQSKGEKAKHAMFNAFTVRLQFAVEAYRPFFTALATTQKGMVRRYEEEAGDDVRYLDNGNISFGPKLDRQYTLEHEELMETPLEDEPNRRPFTGADFDAVGLAVPQSVIDRLGPLFKKPASDPDAIGDEEEPTEETSS